MGKTILFLLSMCRTFCHLLYVSWLDVTSQATVIRRMVDLINEHFRGSTILSYDT